MKRIWTRNYIVYILTNKHLNVLYIGVTNDLRRRLLEHRDGKNKANKSFTHRYNVHYLLYWEQYQYVNDAINREKEIKGWRRSKKEDLIRRMNPEWKFLNDDFGDAS